MLQAAAAGTRDRVALAAAGKPGAPRDLIVTRPRRARPHSWWMGTSEIQLWSCCQRAAPPLYPSVEDAAFWIDRRPAASVLSRNSKDNAGLVAKACASWLACVLVAAAACGDSPRPQNFGGLDPDAEDVASSDEGATSETTASSGRTEGGDEGATSLGQGEDGGAGGPKLDVGVAEGDGGGGGGAGCECAPKLDAIYLLSFTGELWVFHPSTHAFELVADLQCEEQHGFAATTYSMGVGRNGLAWIQYGGGSLYTVDVNAPAQCNKPGYNPGSFGNFGMAFVSNGPDDPCDRIYAHSMAPFGSGSLAYIDPDSLERVDIGATDHGLVELTGTGEGRLFAFVDDFDTDGLLAELDKRTGETLSTFHLSGIESGSAFAVAFYGGDFFFFTGDANANGRSEVWRLDYDNSDGLGQIATLVVPAAPLSVVGAGTSTCAPYTPAG